MPFDPCLSGYGPQAVAAVVGGHDTVVSSVVQSSPFNVSLFYHFDSWQYNGPTHANYGRIGGAPW